MQEFNHDWQSAKSIEWEIKPKYRCDIRVSCTHDVRLEGQKIGLPGWILLHSASTFRIKPLFEGFEKLRLIGDQEFGFWVRDMPVQDGEPLNDENPPSPPMPGDDNLLLQMKRMMRAEMMRNRSPVLEPENLPMSEQYAIDDDDYRFEEEIMEAAEKARQDQINEAQAERNRLASQAARDDTSERPSSEPDSQASAPEARPAGSSPKPVKHAAE